MLRRSARGTAGRHLGAHALREELAVASEHAQDPLPHERQPYPLLTLMSRRRMLCALASGAALAASLLAACQPSTPAAQQASGPPPANKEASGPPATPAPAASTSADTIKIGAVVPITGRYAALGEQVKNGYELAFKDLNKDGVMIKALGKRVTLEMNLLDNASDATQTVQRLESLTASDHVLAYLGGAGSDLHAAAAPIGDKNQTPYIAVAFGFYKPHQQGYKFLFSPFPKTPLIATTLFDVMDGLSPKPSRVAIWIETTDPGLEFRDSWKQEAQKRSGYEIAIDEQYAPGAQDYSSMILKSKAANANAVLTFPAPPDGIAMAKQMKELDYTPDFAFFIRASDGLNWGTSLGKDGDYFVNAPGWNPAVKFPGAAQVAQAHQAAYNKTAEALVGPAYGAVQILFDAVSRMSAVTGDALRVALLATDMTTVAGPMKMNADGTAQLIELVQQWQNGKQELVWPKDQATQQLMYPAKPFKDR